MISAAFSLRYLLIHFVLLSGCGLQEVENYGQKPHPSPDGSKVAVWYYRSAVATTAEVTALAVYDAKNGPGDTLDNPVLVVDKKLSVFPSLSWKGQNAIKVDLSEVDRAKTFVKATDKDGVNLAYDFADAARK
jgi:hypothetical protein